MQNVVTASLILLCALASPVFAGRSIPFDAPIRLRLEIAQPTALVFPEPIASVSVAMPETQFSLDQDGPYLILKPLDPTVAGRFFVVGQSGKLYTIHFRVSPPADDVVHLVAAPPAVPAVPITPSSFLRALRTGTVLPGQQPADLPTPALGDTRLSLTDAHATAMGSLLGLVLTLRNTQATALVLDLRLGETPPALDEGTVALQGWTLPPHLTVRAVAAEEEVLAPDTHTRVYFILERRP